MSATQRVYTPGDDARVIKVETTPVAHLVVTLASQKEPTRGHLGAQHVLKFPPYRRMVLHAVENVGDTSRHRCASNAPSLIVSPRAELVRGEK